MTKEDFLDWKKHPVTQAVYDVIQTRIDDLKSELGYTAGIDLRTDAARSGSIQAFLQLLNLDFEETQ